MLSYIKRTKNAFFRSSTTASIGLALLGLSFLLPLVAQADSQMAPSEVEASFKVTNLGQGPDVILIPGLMSDASIWSELTKELVKSNRVHLINLAGFASTARIEKQSLLRVKHALLKYIENNKMTKPSIIGHSLGGFVAFWLASSAPDEIGPIVSVDGLPFIGPVFTRTNETTVASLAPQAKQIKAYYAQMSSKQLVAQARQSIAIQATSEEAKQKVIAMAASSDPETVGEAISSLMSTDLRESISTIKSPALLIGAAGGFTQESDKLAVKALYQQQLSKLNGAKLIMNNQARHFIMLDQPQWLAEQIVQFLKQSSLSLAQKMGD